ncbi:sulfite exporter TauE/SafE family protein [bacterium]|nr:sulfite exporter TauE/SafE family protein [bacterium]
MHYELIILPLAAFFAGFVDAAVGGGGLIQVPALLALFPHAPLPTLFGTNKFSSICGTSLAAYTYIKRVTIPCKLLFNAIITATIFAFLGAKTITLLDPALAKPLIIILIFLAAFYTFKKKDFGTSHDDLVVSRENILRSGLIAAGLGFYEGFFGPGTGSMLIFCFVRFMKIDFLHASAFAKFVNLSANLSPLIYFISTGHILWRYALPMALCNLIGSRLGTNYALKHGNARVRILFLCVLSLLIAKLIFDYIK